MCNIAFYTFSVNFYTYIIIVSVAAKEPCFFLVAKSICAYSISPLPFGGGCWLRICEQVSA